MAKKRNMMAGFSFGSLDFIIGNRSILKAEPPQFIMVE
jgi:hypothetical protein